MSLGWIYLIIAGLFEVGFTTAMNFFGRSKGLGEAAFLVCVILSFTFLTLASRTVPIGIGYAVWTGIGAAGTLAVSTLVFKQPITGLQIVFVLVLIGAVAGLKLTAGRG